MMHLYLMKVSNYPFKNNHKFYINWSHWMTLVIQTNLFSRSECKQTCLTNSGSFKNILSSNSVSSTLFSPAFVFSLHTTYLCDLMEHFSPAFPLITPQQDSGMGCSSEPVFMWRTVPFIHVPSLPPRVLRSGWALSDDLHLCADCNSTWCSLCLGSDFSQEDNLELKVLLYMYMILRVFGMY